jgi:hypothetical protein
LHNSAIYAMTWRTISASEVQPAWSVLKILDGLNTSSLPVINVRGRALSSESYPWRKGFFFATLKTTELRDCQQILARGAGTYPGNAATAGCLAFWPCLNIR